MGSRTASLALTLLLALPAALAGCDDDDAAYVTATVPGGDPLLGKAAIRAHGCNACHRIAGIPGMAANVGPPLRDMARQAYIGGVLPNTPENLVRWIIDPPSVDPRTAMPDLGIGDAEARHIAAYLYSTSHASPGGPL